ncbi:MAG TPA: low temperature requirement protein A [Propionibacteriaceae bacterium]|nr:low temperature requirement protein A [Propionibacteriaceae bacterium]
MVRPPALAVGEDRSASRLELFFDLAYVLVVMQLVSAFTEDLTWSGLLVLLGLFVVIWLSWMGFTLYANRFDTDDVVFRMAKLSATLAIAGCAASASDAVGAYAVPFAACYLAGRLILLGLYLRAWRHVADARPTINVYLTCIAVSAALWAVSLAFPGPTRYILWATAVLVDALGPALATLRSDKLPLHIEHLPERFGLFVILVLGEALGGVVRGVHDASWSGPAVLAGLIGFVVIAALWWIYFDVGADKSADDLVETEAAEAEPSDDAVDERHDLFVYGHLPMTFGIVLAGVGLEELVLHPDTPVPSAYGWLLAGGAVLFLLGIVMVVGGTARRWRSVWPWPLAALPLLPVLASLPMLTSTSLLGLAAAVLIGIAVVGTVRARGEGQQPEGERPSD